MTGMDLGLVLGDLLLDFGLDDSTLQSEKSFGERGRKSWSSLKKSENLQGDDEVEED